MVALIVSKKKMHHHSFNSGNLDGNRDSTHTQKKKPKEKETVHSCAAVDISIHSVDVNRAGNRL